jgi:hypothetical protein
MSCSRKGIRYAKVYKNSNKRGFHRRAKLLTIHYGKKIWKRCQGGTLQPEAELTGCFKDYDKQADAKSIMRIISYAKEETMRRHSESENFN